MRQQNIYVKTLILSGVQLSKDTLDLLQEFNDGIYKDTNT